MIPEAKFGEKSFKKPVKKPEDIVLGRAQSPAKKEREAEYSAANPFDMLITSWKNKPQFQDSTIITPANPIALQKRKVQFPTMPMLTQPEIFEKLDEDTLFFIFYFQQGTFEQFLAAKELKRRNWAFHKKYLTWFQRYDDPKVETKEKEQGAYVYFDYESGWCKKIKKDFTIEFQMLENELIPQCLNNHNFSYFVYVNLLT